MKNMKVKDLIKNKEKMKYTIAHRKAFRTVEKQLLGHNTFRSLFHDFDKMLLYPFFDKEKISKWHRNYSRHHEKHAKTNTDIVQMVIDWECARYTQPDKPLNARQTLEKFYPHLTEKVLPIIEQLNL